MTLLSVYDYLLAVAVIPCHVTTSKLWVRLIAVFKTICLRVKDRNSVRCKPSSSGLGVSHVAADRWWVDRKQSEAAAVGDWPNISLFMSLEALHGFSSWGLVWVSSWYGGCVPRVVVLRRPDGNGMVSLNLASEVVQWLYPSKQSQILS